MLIVTGTMRSGTSMWMQILVAAGFEVIGEKFPRDWADSLAAANPDGFYESELVSGIYYRTNPHPVSGAYLFPERTRSHLVKVFIPGLIRTDVAFIDRVVATMRPWREYASSVARMERIAGGDVGGSLPPELRWWTENFALVRDLATRRYPIHVTAYDRLLDDPVREIREVLSWIGAGDPEAAIAAVRPQRRTQGTGNRVGPVSSELDGAHLAVFDALYERVRHGEPLSAAFVDELNATDRALRPRIMAHGAQEQIEHGDALRRELERRT